MYEKELLNRITINPNVRFGKPTLRNSRITVFDILSWLASGMTYDEILNDYDFLEKEDIQASVLYALEKITPQSHEKS